jgi:hypothetical protein
MLVWAEPHCFGQRPGFSALINGCAPSLATRSFLESLSRVAVHQCKEVARASCFAAISTKAAPMRQSAS